MILERFFVPYFSPDAPHSAPGGPTIRIRVSGAFELWGVYLGGPADGLNTRDISHSGSVCWRRVGTLLPPPLFSGFPLSADPPPLCAPTNKHRLVFTKK